MLLETNDTQIRIYVHRDLFFRDKVRRHYDDHSGLKSDVLRKVYCWRAIYVHIRRLLKTGYDRADLNYLVVCSDHIVRTRKAFVVVVP